MNEETQLAGLVQRALLAKAPIGIAFTRERKFFLCNAKMESIFGYGPGEMVGLAGSTVHVSAEDYADFGQRVAPLLASGLTVNVDKRFRRKDGTTFHGHIFGTPLDPEDAIDGGTMWTVEDITERVTAEQEVIASERRFRATLEAALDCMITIDSQDRIVELNKSAEETFGYSREEIIGSLMSEVIVPQAYRAGHLAGLEKYRATGEGPILNKRIEISAMRRDGSVFPVELAVVPFENAGETFFCHYMRDIGERRRAQQLLAAREAQYRLLADNQSDFIFLYDTDGSCLYHSPSYERFLAHPARDPGVPYQVERRGVFDPGRDCILHPEDTQRVQQEFRAIVAHGGEKLFQHRWRLRTGEIKWVETRMSAVSGADGGTEKILAVVRDITQRHRTEEQIRELQTLEALGHLAGGMAHDFNNLLGIVVGNLDVLEEYLGSGDEQAGRRIRNARNAALRGAEVTRSLLTVARRQPLQVQQVDINALIVESLPLLATSVGSAVKVRTQLAEGQLVAELDPSGLTSSLINLAINARDAMAKIPGEKLLTIRTRREEIVQGAAHQQQHLRPGWYAVVETTDTGIGMSEAIRAQAFQPLFTTKERGKGTGLGLAMVRGYAEQLGGSASIHSQPDAGTTVCMHLPLELRRAEVDARAEAERLAALDSSGLLDTPADERFDALLGEAARVTGAPIALVSLVDASRQRFKAKLGLSIEETPRETAFCAEAIHHPGKITLVPDAAVDPRFSGSPLVVAEPGIRFYAGVPIRDPQGHALGTLCVLDREPRELDAAQQAQLERLALRVEELIAERLSADRTPRGAGSPRLAQPKRDGLPRVLVVDDEKELCDVAIAWLESLDHEAVAAHTAQQALERLAAQPFDVLFSDVVMPGGMDGIQLAEEAQLRHPGLRIILTSGYADSLLDKNIQVHWPLIRKPYRKSDLAGVLRADPPP